LLPFVFVNAQQGISMSTNVEHSFSKLRELIKDIRFAMFTTRGSDGTLRSWPMTTQSTGHENDTDNLLWFFMSLSGEPVRELMAQPQVNVSYADTDDDAYVSISGTATLVEDPDMKLQLWSTMAQAWFPGGIDDPDLGLVCVRIESAEYWNVTEGKLTQVAKMAKAALTGKPPPKMGEHGKIVKP
jgi:general stress protein 26